MDEKNFAERAGQSIRRALEDWGAGNEHFAVLHSGFGCEYALKAFLMRRNPGLIDSSRDKTLIHYTLGTSAKPDQELLKKARTISLKEAFEQATVIWGKNAPITHQQFAVIVEGRDGETHLGWHLASSAARGLQYAVTLIEVIRADLNAPSAVFWGPYDGIFADLDKVKKVAVSALRPGLEDAVEALARREFENAMSATDTAFDGKDSSAYVATWTALQTVGAVAQRQAVRLLTEYDVLPLAPQPVSHAPTRMMFLRAQDALAVKESVARAVFNGFMEGCASRPSTGGLLKPSARGNPNTDVGTLVWPTPVSRRVLTELAPASCSACHKVAVIYGNITEEDCGCERESGSGACLFHPGDVVRWAYAELYYCSWCSLTLDHPAELEAASIRLIFEWEREDYWKE